MAYGTIYNSKVVSYEITEYAGTAFADVEKFIPESQPISINSSDISFFSQAILWSFDTNTIAEHFEKNPINAYVEILVEYSVTSSGPSFAFRTNINGQFCFDKKTIPNIVVYATNDFVTQNNSGETRQATFRIYADSLPKNEIMSSEKFGFLLNVYCSNAAEQIIDLYINNIEINIYSSSDGSFLAIFDSINKIFIGENESSNLGKIYPQVTLTGNFKIYNFGSQKLFVDKDGISSEIPNLTLVPKVDKEQLFIEYLQYLEVPFIYSGQNAASDYSATISLQTTANNSIGVGWLFVYNFSTTALSTGKIQISYNNQKLVVNDAISLLTLPQGVNNKFDLTLKNIGDVSLSVTSVDFAGLLSAKVAEDFSNITLAPNEQKIIEINIQDQILGAGFGSVTVKSTDPTQSVFKVDAFVEIGETFKLVVKNGVEANYAENTINNGDTINLGILSRNRGYRKYYNLSNSGLLNDIRIDSIQTSSADAYLSDLPILPITLTKNDANFISFAIVFDTASGTLRESDLVINYTKLE